MLASVSDVSAYFQEREDVTKVLLIGMLAQKNVLLLGKPGVAKSAVIRAMTAHCQDARFGDYLMASGTTEDELVGPPRMSAFRDRDVFERNHEGTAAGVEVFFADETFRGNSGARNALLTIMNEHTYKGKPVPLRCLVGASNIEDTSENAEAFNDRFLLRMLVEPIKDPAKFTAYLRAMAVKRKYVPNPAHLFTVAEWDKASEEIQHVDVPESVLNELSKLRLKSEAANIYVSDRRFGDLLVILQTCAWLDDLSAVETDHLDILRHGMWCKLSDRLSVKAWIDTLDSGDVKWLSDTADVVLREIRDWQRLSPQEKSNRASAITQSRKTAQDAIRVRMAGASKRAKDVGARKIKEMGEAYLPVMQELYRQIGMDPSTAKVT
jgi:MoxR-like ATPase